MKKGNTHQIDFPGLHLSRAHVNAVEDMIKDAKKKTIYRYPWEKLEENLENKDLSGTLIVGYGSLLNITSASKTLSKESLRTFQPVIAFGARRLFNYEMPWNTERYGPPTNPIARAALNIRITQNAHDVVNGVLINVAAKDIAPIRKREIGYDLIPVVCVRWNRVDMVPFLAYIFCCPEGLREGKRLTSRKIMPHRKYYLLCRKGAHEYGDEFLRLWLATTYLADGTTTVAQWEVNEFPEII